MSESEFERVIFYDDGWWMKPEGSGGAKLMDGGEVGGEGDGERVEVAVSGEGQMGGRKG